MADGIARLLNKGQRSAARKALNDVAAALHHDADRALLGALLAASSHDWKTALAAAWRATALLPQNAALQRFLGQVCRANGLAALGDASDARAAELAPEKAARTPEAAPKAEKWVRKRGHAEIDVIVPIHADLEATRECLETLVTAKNEIAANLILIDDAILDLELAAFVKDFSAREECELLHNKINRGFGRSVNSAVRADRDVVILNADTAVHDGWLDRLHAAALSSEDIGIVCPLSNNAQLLSWPKVFEANPFPSAAQRAALGAAAVANSGSIVDLPVAIGFCMYVKHACWKAVTGFDCERFGAGYGEDGDLSLRAAALGWRTVAATDVFVAHRGARSFGDRKGALVRRHMPILVARFPGHVAEITRFEQHDPLARARNTLSRAVLPRLEGRPVLHLLERPGPLHRACDPARGSALTLTPIVTEGGTHRLCGPQTAPVQIDYALPADLSSLLGDLERLGVRCFIDQTAGGAIAELLEPALDALESDGGLGSISEAFTEGEDDHLLLPGQGWSFAAFETLKVLLRAASRRELKSFVLGDTLDNRALERIPNLEILPYRRPECHFDSVAKALGATCAIFPQRRKTRCSLRRVITIRADGEIKFDESAMPVLKEIVATASRVRFDRGDHA